jgi:hypothetical protein
MEAGIADHVWMLVELPFLPNLTKENDETLYDILQIPSHMRIFAES